MKIKSSVTLEIAQKLLLQAKKDLEEGEFNFMET